MVVIGWGLKPRCTRSSTAWRAGTSEAWRPHLFRMKAFRARNPARFPAHLPARAPASLGLSERPGASPKIMKDEARQTQRFARNCELRACYAALPSVPRAERWWLGWRRERDSNPRDGFPPTHFPGVRLRPLGHLSDTRDRNHPCARRASPALGAASWAACQAAREIGPRTLRSVVVAPGAAATSASRCLRDRPHHFVGR